MLSRFIWIAAALACTYAAPVPSAGGFVSVSGTKFMIGGKPFPFHGTNAYYISLNSKQLADEFFTTATDLSIKVVRTWAFSDVNAADEGKGIWFQSFNGKQVKFNDEANGLQMLDYVIQQAGQKGIKLVLPLVNNWPDFGGMDLYVKSFGGTSHGDFYTNADIKNAFKDYAKHVIQRTNSLTGVPYSQDPTIMAWELTNEARCKATELPRGSCSSSDIVSWMTEMSAFIKTLDSNHLVSPGDEGFFARKGEQYPDDGSDGTDFEKIMAIKSLDFGTFHTYPESFGRDTRTYGVKAVQDHSATAGAMNKPVVWEEYGIKDKALRPDAITQWHATLGTSNISGSLVWMVAGPSYADFDGFTVHPGDPFMKQLVTDRIAAINAGGNANPAPPTAPAPAPGSPGNLICSGTTITATDSVGRKWGFENGQSCLIRTCPGTPVMTVDSTGNAWGFENGQSCLISVCAGNTVTSVDSTGKAWGFENGQSCLIKTCAGKTVTETDTVGRKWGFEDGKSCLVV